MFKEEFVKFDEKTNLCVYIWTTEKEKKGTIQIAHGMAEYLGRYHGFAEYFNNLGYDVLGCDLYAHGKSVKDVKDIGVVQDYDFMEAMIASIRLVRTTYAQMFTGKAILFSHSMGSMTSQRYIEVYPDDFVALILSGTDYPKGLYGFAKLLTCVNGKQGKIKYSKFIDGLGVGAFNKGLENEHPTLAWLSTNKDNYLAYEKDPLCGAMFPANYYHSLAKMLLISKKRSERSKINPNLDILLVAGEKDPVGGCGKGPTKLAKEYASQLKGKVKVRLFKDARHECLNEVEPIRSEFLEEIANFIE